MELAISVMGEAPIGRGSGSSSSITDSDSGNHRDRHQVSLVGGCGLRSWAGWPGRAPHRAASDPQFGTGAAIFVAVGSAAPLYVSPGLHKTVADPWRMSDQGTVQTRNRCKLLGENSCTVRGGDKMRLNPKTIFRGARQLAEYLGVSPNAVHVLVNRGLLPVRRQGR